MLPESLVRLFGLSIRGLRQWPVRRTFRRLPPDERVDGALVALSKFLLRLQAVNDHCYPLSVLVTHGNRVYLGGIVGERGLVLALRMP